MKGHNYGNCKNCGKVHKHPLTGKKHNENTKQKMREKAEKRTGNKSGSWKGGKIINGGYVYIYLPRHPNATKQGYVCEHRLVMENHLKRFLLPKEVVHHINGDIMDNRLENLKLFSNSGDLLLIVIFERDDKGRFCKCLIA